MKSALIILIGWMITVASNCQTRLYIGLGSNSITYLDTKPAYLGIQNNSISTSGQFTSTGFGTYNRVDLNLEKRVFGSIYMVMGLSYFNAGYTHGNDNLYYYSRLKNTYISAPVLFRFNLYNSHVMYFDFGVAGNYLLKANLRERWYQDTAEGDITNHISRFSAGYVFQFTVVVNRFLITAYKYGKAPSTADDFSSEWDLPRNGSSFMLYVNRFSIRSTGLRISYRIR